MGWGTVLVYVNPGFLQHIQVIYFITFRSIGQHLKIYNQSYLTHFLCYNHFFTF